MSETRRRLRSKKTYKMNKIWGASDVGQFFVTEPTDVATKSSHIYCRTLSQGPVGADSWSPRNFAALPGQQTLSARPTSEFGDTRLGSAGLWGECHESSRSRTPTGENNEAYSGRERQGVRIFRRRHCWRNWCGGPKSCGDGEWFLPHWRVASVWKLWASLPALGAVHSVLSVWTWMSSGHATRLWLVFIFAQYIVRGPCGSNWLAALANHPERDVSADFVSLHQLGKVAWELQRGIWVGRRQSAGVSSHVGDRHLQESLCGNAGSLQQRYSSRNFSIGSNIGCIGAWRVGGVNQRWLTRNRGSFSRISGQWVPSRANWLPILWSSPV